MSNDRGGGRVLIVTVWVERWEAHLLVGSASFPLTFRVYVHCKKVHVSRGILAQPTCIVQEGGGVTMSPLQGGWHPLQGGAGSLPAAPMMCSFSYAASYICCNCHNPFGHSV